MPPLLTNLDEAAELQALREAEKSAAALADAHFDAIGARRAASVRSSFDAAAAKYARRQRLHRTLARIRLPIRRPPARGRAFRPARPRVAFAARALASARGRPAAADRPRLAARSGASSPASTGRFTMHRPSLTVGARL